MSARTPIHLALAAALLAPAPPMAQVATDWTKIAKPPLRPFQPQQPRRLALPNGLVIFLQEDHELPLVRGTAHVRGGSREEPGAKAGMIDIYGDVWRTGGSTARTGDELDDYLEQRAAKVETSSDIDSTAISFDTLKAALDEVFPVWLELLRQPAFREDKIDLAKNQVNTGISRRNDEPSGIASREANRLVYGRTRPTRARPEYATVAAVTREDLLAWHRSHVHPNNVIVCVIGDFDSREPWRRACARPSRVGRGGRRPRIEIAFQDPRPGVYLIEKDDVTQSNVRLVHLGTTRNNPDYFALEVMNEVFGGGFSARLFTNVRTKKGLAYGVGGGVGTGWDHPGVFQVGLGTKSETTLAGIDALMEEIDDLHKTPATPDELRRAKDAILNSFVFRFDTKAKVLREKLLYEFYGYPPDFLEKLPLGGGGGDGRRCGAGGAEVRAQGPPGHPGGGQAVRLRQAAHHDGRGDAHRHHHPRAGRGPGGRGAGGIRREGQGAAGPRGGGPGRGRAREGGEVAAAEVEPEGEDAAGRDDDRRGEPDRLPRPCAPADADAHGRRHPGGGARGAPSCSPPRARRTCRPRGVTTP